MIVDISAEAEPDLEAIGDHIAHDDPMRALSFVRELRAKCRDLGHMPMRFPLVPHLEEHGVRRRVHGNYLIFYRTDREQVTIIHVLHGAMDYGTIFLRS